MSNDTFQDEDPPEQEEEQGVELPVAEYLRNYAAFLYAVGGDGADIHRFNEIARDWEQKPFAPAAQFGSSPLAEFVALDRERREWKEREKHIIGRQTRLTEMILEQWADSGLHSARCDRVTVSIDRPFYCSKKAGVETETVIQVLESEGLGGIVKPGYAAASLKAWIKEQVEAGAEPSPALASVLSWGTLTRLKTRKA